MELSTYLTFIVVSAAQVASPGPSVVFLLNNALLLGGLRAIVVLTGDLLAILLMASLSVFGLATLLHEYPGVFLALRLFGAIYVLWLGFGYFQTPESKLPQDAKAGSRRDDLKLWLHSFGVGISNPKAVLFFAALFPQFIPVGSSTSQLLLLVVTFVAVKLIILGSFAIAAKRIGHLLKKPKHAILGRKVTGVVFIIFALVMIFSALTA